jgi:hypothetical protein
MPPFVPQVIGWALGALGAAVVAKILSKQWQRVNDELHPAESVAEAAGAGRIPRLRRDPKSGIYRPE